MNQLRRQPARERAVWTQQGRERETACCHLGRLRLYGFDKNCERLPNLPLGCSLWRLQQWIAEQLRSAKIRFWL
jgi:hypothetical protein